MRTILSALFHILLTCWLHAEHNGSIRGSILDAVSQSPLSGVSVELNGPQNGRRAYTDELGLYQFSNLPAGFYRLSIRYLGYQPATVEGIEVRNSETATVRTFLEAAPIELSDVEITADPDVSRQTIAALDISLRPVSTAQDVLRIVPGLFIAQHAGGGKAEQIFLRGFDIDHGTDVALSVDGIPVNMVSHAHGQGYADLHFLIPEVLERVQFAKGPYSASSGNLATAGYVGFQTRNILDKNMVKLSAGQFGTFRTLGAFKILDKPEGARPQNAYFATEYAYSNGYFDSPQAYNRFSTFLKYNTALNANTLFSSSIGAFKSRWDASGQIPERAVARGLIGRFGAIDDTEGGSTDRTNLNFQLHTVLTDGSLLKNQFYYSRYNFELYSNFTFNLTDPINGDQIRQREKRSLLGASNTYAREDRLGHLRLNTEAGLSFRFDDIQDNELSHTKGRRTVLENRALGDINEYNVGVYLEESIRLSERLLINSGIRFDQFQFMYIDKLQETYDRKIKTAALVSPKLNAYFTFNPRVQLFALSGYGFHSNDTRVVITQEGNRLLPRAFGIDFGAHIKVLPRLLMTLGGWRLHLEQEFVYVGDEAVVEPSGATTRQGFDLALRWQLASWLFADADLNYALARADDTPEEENYIPLAAAWTSIGGLSWQMNSGWNGSLRYRFLGDRPANEDNSVVARGYFLTDLVLKYTQPRFEIGLAVQNLLNRAWNEAQFNTESRLADEMNPVSEIHFTPGTPFNAVAHFSLFF